MPSNIQGRFFLTTCLFAAMASSLHAGALNAIYVFGDSLSDAGNAYIASGGALPAPAYVDGHFTNGQVWVQDLAANMGLPAVTASLAGGTDYAVGGAESGTTPVHTAGATDLSAQLAAFQATHAVANPNGLYTIWIGANDLRAILASNPSTTAAATDVAAVIQNIDTTINALAGEGAKNFLIVTVPDLGKTPEALATGPVGAAAASSLSYLFDTSLVSGLGAIAAADGVNMNVLDAYSLIDQVVANPSQYGLTNVTSPCLTGEVNYSGGTPCANPNQYLFWDQLHPTAAVHSLVADQAFLVLAPEPTTLTMTFSAFGMAGLAAVLRRRKTGLLN